MIKMRAWGSCFLRAICATVAASTLAASTNTPLCKSWRVKDSSKVGKVMYRPAALPAVVSRHIEKLCMLRLMSLYIPATESHCNWPAAHQQACTHGMLTTEGRER